jgi:hypothetical protein
MPKPAHLLSWLFSVACFFCLSACLFDDPPWGPTLAGHFGNRLDGLPPQALLDSSYVALGMMRGLSGDSYEYQMGSHSFMGTGGSYWKVAFRAGVPVREEFVSTGADGKKVRKVETSEDWSAPMETRQDPLPDPVPLDSVYAECRILLDPCAAPAFPEFTYDRNYILSWCGCHDSRLADGTPAVSLEKLDWDRD